VYAGYPFGTPTPYYEMSHYQLNSQPVGAIEPPETHESTETVSGCIVQDGWDGQPSQHGTLDGFEDNKVKTT